MKRMKRLLLGLLCVTGLTLASCNKSDVTNTLTTNESSVSDVKTHDKNSLKVNGKDKYEPHNYINGKCSMCDETTNLVQDPIGGTDKMKECDKKGEVVEINYNTRSYYTEAKYPLAGELKLTKTAYVYLPYGYNSEDKTTKYNVLYLLHGHGLNEGYWFAKGSYSPSDNCYTKGFGTQNVLDNLMESGKAEKTIIVTPTFYSRVSNYPVDDGEWDITKYFYLELINDLMPYIASNYNTYANSSSQEDLKANRLHQAYAGLSMGSIVSFESIWTNALEYFSYIGSYSAMCSTETNQEIINKKNTTYKDYDIKYWYVTFGSSEYKEQHLKSYLEFINGVSGLKQGTHIENGDNATFMLVNKTAHNYATWITALYNSMQLFFKG